MACLSQALRLGGLLPPHNAFQDTFLTMQDGPHRSCPRAQRVPVHPKVFPHSYLPLSRHSERQQLMAITRGLPHLRKLREIMEHIYALFDRRCHTQTALGKLKKLRQWVKRFTWIGDALKKVFAPTLEKALTFLDDKLLPATSNAVERGNRRHRKMQKSVYRVRSKVCLEGRIALDMLRESRTEGRDHTTQALHKARRGGT